MSTEQQAQLLAEWLDSHPGQEPPADLDPEVVEALYVLRPDLAPAPRVTVDDILGGLTAGPFADGGAYASEDEVDAERAPTQPVWAGEDAYATEDEVDAERAPTQPVWAGEDEYATEDEVEDDGVPTEMVARPDEDIESQPTLPAEGVDAGTLLDEDAASAVDAASPIEAVDAASPIEAVDAASPIEAVDAASPIEAVDAASPIEAVDAASPIEASQRSREEREADPAAKARARLAVLPSPKERREQREREEAERARKRRRRMIFGTGGLGGGLALAAVLMLALRGVVLAPDNEPALAPADEVAEAPRIFENEEAAEADDAPRAASATREPSGGEGRFAMEGEPTPAPDAKPARELKSELAKKPAERQAKDDGMAFDLEPAADPPPPAARPRPRPAPSPAPASAPAPMAQSRPDAYGSGGLALEGDANLADQGGDMVGGSGAGSTADKVTRGRDYADSTTVTTGEAGPSPTAGAEVAEMPEAEEAASAEEVALDAVGYLSEDLDDAEAEPAPVQIARADRAEAISTESKRKQRDGLFSGRRKSAAPQAQQEPAAPEEPVATPTAADEAPATTSTDAPADLGTLRTRAMPTDLPSEPAISDRTAMAEYRIVSSGADAYETNGAPLEAANQLAGAVAPPADIGMAHAARASKLYADNGAYARAADTARKGLGLSSANTAWRSLLYVRLGDAMRGLGDPSGAQSAYEKAIELNAAR